MLNQEIISAQVEPLHYEQTVQQAIEKMDALEIEQLPLVKDGLFEGLLFEEDLLDAKETDRLTQLQYKLQPTSVHAEDHYLTAAKMMAAIPQLKVLPVVKPGNHYLGVITSAEIFKQLLRLSGAQESGALVVLEMNREDYSISNLSKLVETNDAQINQLNTYTDELTGRLIVTLRLNKQEVSDVVATFQRYDYQVVFHAGEEEYQNELKRNYHNLMNFLEI